MKKINKDGGIFLTAILSLFLITGCGAGFSGGAWIIPLLTFLGAVFFGYKAYVSSKSNSTTQLEGQQGTIDNTGNVPIWKLGYFKFSVALVVATIIIIALMGGEN